MKRNEAINVLEDLLDAAYEEESGINIYFSGREALKIAIADMKDWQRREDLQDEYPEVLKSWTIEDWEKLIQKSE